jgi:hypothetical protein
VSRDPDVEGDGPLQRDGVFGVFEKVFEILGRFSKALVWACGSSNKLGFKSLLGFKRRVGFVAGRVLKRVKLVVKRFRAGAIVVKPYANLDAGSGLKGYSVSGGISGRRSGPGCSLRSMEVLGSACRPISSAADSGVDLGLSPSEASPSDQQIVPVVESVESVNPVTLLSPLPAPFLFPPVILSDLLSGVRSSLALSASGSGPFLRQAAALPSAGSVLVRSGVEDFHSGELGASSGSAGFVSVGLDFGIPSGALIRQAVVHSGAPALVWNFGGDLPFGKVGGPPGVSAFIPPLHWVLFPPWPRPLSSVVGCSQLHGVSSGIVEVGDSSKGVDPKKSVVVYPRVVEESRSCFRTMGVTFMGSD